MTRKERIMQEAFKDMITTQGIHYSDLEDKAREVQPPVYADAMRELKKNAKTRKEFVDDRIEEVTKYKEGPMENKPKTTEAQKKMYLSESLFEAIDEKGKTNRLTYHEFVDYLDSIDNGYASFSKVNGAKGIGYRYTLANKLTREQHDYLAQYDNIDFGEAQYKYAPEIKYDTVVLLDRMNKSAKDVEESIVTRKGLRKLRNLAKNETIIKERLQHKVARNTEELREIINEWDGDSLNVSIQPEDSNSHFNIYYYFDEAAGGYYEVPKSVASFAIEYDLQSAKATALKYVDNFFKVGKEESLETECTIFPEGYFAKYASPNTKISSASMLDESLKNDEIIKVADLAAEIGIETLAGLKHFIEHEVKGGDLLKSLQAYKTKLGDDFELGKENKDIKEDLDISFTAEQAQEIVDKINSAYKADNGADGTVTSENNGIANMLITAINDEWETVKMYNDLIVNMETFGYTNMTEVIRDVINEENKHIGQLSKALETISPNVANIEKGEQEAEEQLDNNTEVK